METPVRVGAVNYLNTKPLICDLDGWRRRPSWSSTCRAAWPTCWPKGELDVALIPVIEYFRAGGYSRRAEHRHRLRGPVLSVTLFSRVPWTAIRRVALDAGSRTSAALTRILLAQRYGVEPEVVPLPMDRAAEDVDADAVLLIGDRAMRACLPGFHHAFDLGQEWFDWTGLPFVYAVWAVRRGSTWGRGRRHCTRPSGAAWTESAPSPRRGAAAGAGRRLLPPLSVEHPAL